MAIYMSVKGTQQGVMTGGVTSGNYKGQILVNSVHFSMGHPVNSNTGLTTGKQVAKPVVVSKPTDMSSPLLLSSCQNNENLTTVMITYVFEGALNKAVSTTKLTNATVQDFDHKAQSDGSSVETVTFSYQKCEFTWIDGGIATAWDLTL
jgi:type VI secretion system Hcp family effector